MSEFHGSTATVIGREGKRAPQKALHAQREAGAGGYRVIEEGRLRPGRFGIELVERWRRTTFGWAISYQVYVVSARVQNERRALTTTWYLVKYYNILIITDAVVSTVAPAPSRRTT